MTIANCPHCGGTHFGSTKCPFLSVAPTPGAEQRIANTLDGVLRDCSDLELVSLQHQARQVDDQPLLAAVLAELQRRVRAGEIAQLRPEAPRVG